MKLLCKRRRIGEIQNFDELLTSAQGVVKTLKDQKIVGPEFDSFLAETGFGDSLSVIRLFSGISQLQSRYKQWDESRKGDK